MLRRLLLFLLAAALLAGCGGGNNGDGGDDAGTSDTGDGRPEPMSCEEFEEFDDGGGESCAFSSDCKQVPCPCEDGEVANSRSCINGICEGKFACEDACMMQRGTGYACDDGSGS